MNLTKEQTQAIVDFYNTLPNVPESVKGIFENMRDEVYPEVEETVQYTPQATTTVSNSEVVEEVPTDDVSVEEDITN